MKFRIATVGLVAALFATGVAIHATRPARVTPPRIVQAFASDPATDDAALLALARSGGDCTAALQARIAAAQANSGRVVLPNGGAQYKITDTLVLGDPVNGAFVSLIGPGVNTATLVYAGDPAKPALRIEKSNWGYRLEGFNVSRYGSDKQGVGILCAPATSLGVGTVEGDAVWEQVATSGFEIGAQLGTQQGDSTSELTLIQCKFSNCDIGLSLRSFNTLNVVCLNLGLGGNRIGCYCNEGGWVSVLGGSSGGNTECDFRSTHAQFINITGYRSEGPSPLFIGGGTTAPMGVTITNCMALPGPNAVALSFNGGVRSSVRDCVLYGPVYATGGAQGMSIDLVNCQIKDAMAIHASGQAAAPSRFRVKGCARIDASNNFLGWFDDTQFSVPPEASPIPAIQIVDDGDATGWSTTGTWTAWNNQGFQGDVHEALPGNGSAAAIWTFNVVPGIYRVSATWNPYTNRATNAPYTVYDGSTSKGTVRVNQQAPPAGLNASGAAWKDLGYYTIAGNTLTVKLTDDANGNLNADAIRIEKVDAVPPGNLFQINLTFTGLTASQQAVFRAAADRWQTVITGPAQTVLVGVASPAIDGPNGVLGSTAPTVIGANGLPTQAIILIDSADMAIMEQTGSLYYVALHEMAHAFGFGTLWDQKNLKAGNTFIGANAVAAYGGPVPLETVGGAGTVGSHWAESVFGNELMTGYLNPGANPMSRVTVASMADLGYTVNMNAADQ